MLIPSGALAVLQSGGAPRALPKVPPLNPHAIQRAGRIGVPVDVRIQHEDRTIDAHTRDVSATGFFAVTSVSFVVGTIVDCVLCVPVSGLSEQSFGTRARIVRRDLGGYGLVFVEPPASLVDAITSLSST
ncbi:MAG: PilZ domain-containing protein [Deltaproteobacteria bacterium]|nr:PilZ domain-containing protein [Deltaproteobacteria bacterium]